MNGHKQAQIAGIYMRVKNPKKIRALMVLQDVSMRQLAEAIGYAGHGYVSAILNGKIKTVTPERAARIARHLDAPIDKLFEPRLSTDGSDNGESNAA